MSIGIGALAIAEPRIARVIGASGIGFGRLRFSLELHFQPIAEYLKELGIVELGSLTGFVSASCQRDSQFKPLGVAVPETSWFTTAADSNLPKHEELLLLLDLPWEQIEALEEVRGGGSLFFQIDLRLQLRSRRGVHVGYQTVSFEANLSIWSDVLKQLGYRELLVVAVELPLDAPAELRSAIEQLGAAHQDLIGGRYDSVVSRCRMAMDALDKAVPSENGAEKLIEVFSQGRKAMSKRARADLVRLAVRHYTHLAHHVDSDGSPESFSRQDALFILTAAAGAIWDAAAELRRRN